MHINFASYPELRSVDINLGGACTPLPSGNMVTWHPFCRQFCFRGRGRRQRARQSSLALTTYIACSEAAGVGNTRPILTPLALLPCAFPLPLRPPVFVLFIALRSLGGRQRSDIFTTRKTVTTIQQHAALPPACTQCTTPTESQQGASSTARK